MPLEDIQTQVVDPEVETEVPEIESQETEPEETTQPEQKIKTPEEVKSDGERQPSVKAEPDGKQVDAQLRAKDAELAQARQQLAQQHLQQTIETMRSAEEQVRARDAKAVDDGDMTQDEAQRRAQLRYETAALKLQKMQMEQEVTQMRSQAEPVAFILAANEIAREIGKEEGLSKEDISELFTSLISDDSAKNADAMKAKAWRFVARKNKEAAKKAGTKPESYDKGPGSSTGKSMNDAAFRKAFASGELSSQADYDRMAKLLNM